MRVVALFALVAAGACTPSGIAYLPPPRTGGGAVAVDVCAPPPAAVSAGGPSARPGAVLARVGGRELTSEDVAREFFKTHRQEAFAALNKLVVREIVQRESERIGLVVPDDVLATERQRAHEDLKLLALRSYGAGTTPERFLEVEFRLTLDEYLRRKEAEAAERWLLARIIRFHGVQSDRVELQLIAVDDEATAREIASKLDQGADFAQLALTHSRHPTAQSGGRLPPLARESLNPAVADRAFALAAGQRSSILSVDDGLGRRQFEIVKVLRRLPGRNVPWAEVAAEVEAGLQAEPLGRDEFIAWNLRLERLHGVWVDPGL